MSSGKYTGYSNKQASKKDEEDLKQYEAATTASTNTTAKKSASLESKLKDAGVDLNTFALGTEEYRKKVLKEDYDELKISEGWTYGTYCKDNYHWDTVKQSCVANE